MDRKRVQISGSEATVSLERGFWDALDEIARDHNSTPTELIAMAANKGLAGSVSSDIRVYVLEFFKRKSVGWLH